MDAAATQYDVGVALLRHGKIDDALEQLREARCEQWWCEEHINVAETKHEIRVALQELGM